MVCREGPQGQRAPAICRRPTRSPYLPYRLEPYTPSIKYPGEFDVNSRGYRGPEFEVPKAKGTFRIVLLGGSTIFETGVPSWRLDSARALERSLREDYG